MTDISKLKNSIYLWERKNITKKNILIALKLVIGVWVSVFIAELLKLNFATSTCVVTLISIQTTKKETVKKALQQLVSVAYTMVFSLAAYNIFGSNSFAFGFAVLCVVLFSCLIGWNSIMSVNVVIMVHLFLVNQPFTTGLIINEVLRVAIGLAVAIAVNWHMPNTEARLKKEIKQIEENLCRIFKSYSKVMAAHSTEEKTIDVQQNIELLDSLIKIAERDAVTFGNNNLSSHAKYYSDYVKFRKDEIHILKDFDVSLKIIAKGTSITKEISDYLVTMSENISVIEPVEKIVALQQSVNQDLSNLPLPKNNEELKNCALIFLIENAITQILEAKKEFVMGITDKQKELYW